jgi:hypothetical protein
LIRNDLSDNCFGVWRKSAARWRCVFSLAMVLILARPCLGLAGNGIVAGDKCADDASDVPESVLRSGPLCFSDLLPQTLDQAVDEMIDDIARGPMIAQIGGFDEFESYDKNKVNVTKATLFSFVLPGAGQWYAGARNRAGIFLAGEGLTWAAFGYFKTVQAAKERDYEALALADAGIDPAGKDDDFYRLLSFYMSRDDYNQAGRIIAPTRPYYPDTEQWDWQWSSEVKMDRYRDLRNQSKEADNRARFALGAMLLNRLIAAVDAWRTARSVNRQALMEHASWKVGVKGSPFSENPRFKLTFKRRF